MNRLAGKVAVVTGAGSGLGYAITKGYIEQGAKVLAADISESVNRLKDEFGESVLTTKVDVSNEDEVKAMINKGIEHFGRIDILINNAGITGPVVKVHEISPEHFRKTIDINLMGPFYGTKHIIPHFFENGGGVIINTASISAYPKFTTEAAYCSSKAAVKRLTENTAYDYAENNIRANAIAPGMIETPIYEGLEDHKKYLESIIPVKKFGVPEDIANMAVFLGADESKYVTGQTFIVDGGYLLA